MSDHDEDTSAYPALGRAMTWVDRPGAATKLIWLLAAACAIVFAAGFMIDMHGHFSVENFGGFYGVYGFVMFTLLIMAAKVLRAIIKRPEDYYGNKAVDSEAYPEDGLERLDHE